MAQFRYKIKKRKENTFVVTDGSIGKQEIAAMREKHKERRHRAQKVEERPMVSQFAGLLGSSSPPMAQVRTNSNAFSARRLILYPRRKGLVPGFPRAVTGCPARHLIMIKATCAVKKTGYSLVITGRLALFLRRMAHGAGTARRKAILRRDRPA
jgi:hypothetical protein